MGRGPRVFLIQHVGHDASRQVSLSPVAGLGSPLLCLARFSPSTGSLSIVGTLSLPKWC